MEKKRKKNRSLQSLGVPSSNYFCHLRNAKRRATGSRLPFGCRDPLATSRELTLALAPRPRRRNWKQTTGRPRGEKKNRLEESSARLGTPGIKLWGGDNKWRRSPVNGRAEASFTLRDKTSLHQRYGRLVLLCLLFTSPPFETLARGTLLLLSYIESVDLFLLAGATTNTTTTAITAIDITSPSVSDASGRRV